MRPGRTPSAAGEPGQRVVTVVVVEHLHLTGHRPADRVDGCFQTVPVGDHSDPLRLANLRSSAAPPLDEVVDWTMLFQRKREDDRTALAGV